MHTRKRVPDDFIVLNEKERVIKEQSQVAEILMSISQISQCPQAQCPQAHCLQGPGTYKQNSYDESATGEHFWIATD